MKAKLTKIIIEEITKRLKVGCYAKTAAAALGISKSTYYYWLERGEKARKLQELGKKIAESENIYLDLLDSVRQAEAEGEVNITTMIFSQIKEDWRAGMEVLARKWPEKWARKEYMDFKGTMESGPNKGEEALNEFESMYKDVPRAALSEIIAETTRKIREAKNGQNGKNQKVQARK